MLKKLMLTGAAAALAVALPCGVAFASPAATPSPNADAPAVSPNSDAPAVSPNSDASAVSSSSSDSGSSSTEAEETSPQTGMEFVYEVAGGTAVLLLGAAGAALTLRKKLQS